jgi:tellurite resistance protein TerC
MTLSTILLLVKANELIFFSLFLVFILSVLVLDLGILSKENKPVKMKEALIWTSIWILCAFIFFTVLRIHGEVIHGITDLTSLQQTIDKFNASLDITGMEYNEAIVAYRKYMSIDFLTGYSIEYALSIDNIFVILLIFSSFKVRERYFKRVLFWGILGALVLRFLFIFIGSAVVHEFHWVLTIFGAFLIYSGAKLFWQKDDGKFDEKNHIAVRLMSKVFRVFPRYIGERFFVRKDKKIWITPLFIVLVVVEFSDLIFAVDSVPAIFSITQDPYIVYSSNIFAIMGLRSLFFLISNVVNLFAYLKYGLSLLLIFIGVKIILHDFLVEKFGFTNSTSLIIVGLILGTSILASVLFPPKSGVESGE